MQVDYGNGDTSKPVNVAKPVVEKEEESFTESTGYVVLLSVGIVLILVLIIVFAALLIKK